MRRTIIVGDIHGCIVEFRALVDKLRLGPEDSLVLIGDLMDKGPDPVACIQYARELGCLCLMGNHEEKHLRWRKHEERRTANPKYKNPMRPLGSEKAAQNAALTTEDVSWMRGLPIMHLPFAFKAPGDPNPPEQWVLVHGGLLPGIPLNEQTDDRLRVRWVNAEGKMLSLDPEDPRQPEGSKLWSEVYDGTDHVVYGHAAHSLSTPRVDRNRLGAECWGIDTGCAYGGRLTALVLETREVVQIQAAKVYQEPPWPIPE